MNKPLQGIKIIDFTHVQAGPACTQLLAWFGADVIKVERPGSGDVTRSQLRDIPGADALYFTMLNSNKRSLAINTKTPQGLEVMEKLVRGADVLVENPRRHLAGPEAFQAHLVLHGLEFRVEPPVEVRELPCSVSFRDTPPSEWRIGSATVVCEAVNHRGPQSCVQSRRSL